MKRKNEDSPFEKDTTLPEENKEDQLLEYLAELLVAIYVEDIYIQEKDNPPNKKLI